MANRKAIKAEDSAALWVAVLERGRLASDFSLIHKATAELERLGVQITFGDARDSNPRRQPLRLRVPDGASP